MKQTYTPPKMTDLGSVRELTLCGTDGPELDATFPTNTPRGDLTFS
jgi:hypothetical protein